LHQTTITVFSNIIRVFGEFITRAVTKCTTVLKHNNG
jgi:hypothetical protein